MCPSFHEVRGVRFWGSSVHFRKGAEAFDFRGRPRRTPCHSLQTARGQLMAKMAMPPHVVVHMIGVAGAVIWACPKQEIRIEH
jgi:hypothetical protein